MPNHIHGIIEIYNNSNNGRTFNNNTFNNSMFNKSTSNNSRDAIYRVSIINNDIEITNVIQDADMEPVIASKDAINRVSTSVTTTATIKKGGITGKDNPMFHRSISKIIRWYKGRCSFEINKNITDISFAWQSRFHDHIIRTEKELYKIRNYIKSNPSKWE